MRFNELKDENGTHLREYAEILQEKAKAHGLTCVMVFAAKDGPNKGIHAISNIASSVPVALIRLGQQMLENAPTETAGLDVVKAPDKVN